MRIAKIHSKGIYNSHATVTTEFTLVLEDGRIGRAAPSQGETVGLFEDNPAFAHADAAQEVVRLAQNELLDRDLTQEELDDWLTHRLGTLGRNNCIALSEAFFHASGDGQGHPAQMPEGKPTTPKLCLNLLNGGWHAYTNPVLSDFHEYLLVAGDADLYEVMEVHAELQNRIHERLMRCETQVINGNPVHKVGAADNRAVVDFLVQIRDQCGLDDKYAVYVDASGGDLWDGNRYCLPLTDNSSCDSDQFVAYWTDLVNNHGLRYSEDPFAETDSAAWRALTAAVGETAEVVGDNFYSTDAARIRRGAEQGEATAALIKPNQAGTVSATRAAIAAAHQTGQRVITSHRSVSTESTFLSWLSVFDHADAIKIGPLLTDYSSIVRLNEIIRLVEGSR